MCGRPPAASIARRLLLLTHGCDFSPHSEIGPGLLMSHPIGITVGSRVSIGSDVALFHGTTLLAGNTGWLSIEDGAEIFTGAYVAGSITVGTRAVVGANAVLDADLAPGSVLTRSHFGRVNG